MKSMPPRPTAAERERNMRRSWLDYALVLGGAGFAAAAAGLITGDFIIGVLVFGAVAGVAGGLL